MSKPKVNSKIKNKNQSSPQRFKGLLVVLVGLVLILITVLWSSLFKNYPVEGQKQMIAIGDGVLQWRRAGLSDNADAAV